MLNDMNKSCYFNIYFCLAGEKLESSTDQFNPSKSVVMYIDSHKLGAARPMVIGSDQLNFVSYYTYLGHIICDNLPDESDMKAKAMQMYARSNMLRQRFHFCSADVKNKLFSTFKKIIYTCVLCG